MNYLFKNTNAYTNGAFCKCDVLVNDGKIAAIGENLDSNDAEIIDLQGKTLIPGLVDVHVHLREPGFEYKETIATGTAAAAHAGYTIICPMPNLNPAPDSIEHLQVELDAIAKDARVKVYPYGCITKGQKGTGELVDFDALYPNICGFSDDGRGVQSKDLMREAMAQIAELNGILAEHCEVNELLNGGYIHAGKYAKAHNHKGICSESEWKEIERNIELSRETGCRFHACHISTKESVELIRKAKAEGLKVTCETAPHYLLLTEDDLQEDGKFKMNPPLRSKEDQKALIEGIVDGTIDTIATDHAPHSVEDKSKGLAGSAFGIVGLETAFPLMYTYFVKKNIISLEKLIELMAIEPRKVFGFEGGIKVGQPADLAVMNLDAFYKINPNDFLSKGKATPFENWQVYGECEMTFVNGKIVYKK